MVDVHTRLDAVPPRPPQPAPARAAREPPTAFTKSTAWQTESLANRGDGLRTVWPSMKGCGRLFEPPLQESPTQPWLTCTHRLDAVPPRTSQPAPVGAAREPPTRAVPGSRPLPVAGNGPCSRPIPTIGEPPFHQRRTVRLAGRDYSADGAYFVTVCTVDREPVFGAVVDGHVRLNAL